MIGPEGTPYHSGLYNMQLSIPQNYPFSAPKLHFLTEIYHCQFSKQGTPCIKELNEQWSPAQTLKQLF